MSSDFYKVKIHDKHKVVYRKYGFDYVDPETNRTALHTYFQYRDCKGKWKKPQLVAQYLIAKGSPVNAVLKTKEGVEKTCL